MCNGNCKFCPFNNNCIVKKEREEQTETIFTNTLNEQVIRDIRRKCEWNL